MATNTIYEAALKYIGRGWAVFPVQGRGKAPATARGFYDASKDQRQILEWFCGAFEHCNIGIRTGQESNLLVLDFDQDKLTQDGVDLLNALKASAPTYTAKTGRANGGIHLYYLMPAAAAKYKKTIYGGVDIKGDGGYVVAPPSLHESGNYYEVLYEREPVAVPGWVLGLITEPAQVTKKFRDVSSGGGALAPTGRGRLSLATATFMTNGAEPGEWNNSLYKAAKDHQEQGYTEEEFLERAEKVTGTLDETDLKTIASAFKKEPKYEPRTMVSAESPFEDKGKLPRRSFVTKDGEEKFYYPVEPCVHYWLEEKGVAYNYRSDEIILPKDVRVQERGLDSIQNRILCDANNAALSLNSDLVSRALSEWVLAKRTAKIAELREGLQHRPDLTDTALQLRKDFVKAICGEVRDLDVAEIGHFIWQCKRKLFRKEVQHHSMVVLYGPQGIGKTTAARRLFEPVLDVTNNMNSLSVLNDARELQRLTKNLVVFIDEMGKSQQVDVRVLKNYISEDVISQRIMRSTEHTTKPNLATFFGCSNEQVIDLIYDHTGVRRFWQINCGAKIDWDFINAFSPLDMWLGVDEEGPSPVIPHLAARSVVQETDLRNKDSVELFLADKCIVGTGEAKSMDLYQAYKTYCEDCGIKMPVTAQRFGRRLREIGIENRRSNGTVWAITLAAPSGAGKQVAG